MENKTDVYGSLGDKRKLFMHWQTRTILVTMVGYAIFYFVRKNFSLAMPGLTAEYGISNKSFGWILFVSSLVYGASRFVNGYVVDRIKGRLVMAAGLLLCAVANFAFGFGVDTMDPTLLQCSSSLWVSSLSLISIAKVWVILHAHAYFPTGFTRASWPLKCQFGTHLTQ